MTRYHRKWDRRERLLRAVQKLLADIINASEQSVIASGRLRSPEAGRLYVRSKAMVARISKELDHGR